MKSARIWSYSGPYFPEFRLNMSIQSECGKIRTRTTPNTDTFYAVRNRPLDVYSGNPRNLRHSRLDVFGRIVPPKKNYKIRGNPPAPKVSFRQNCMPSFTKTGTASHFFFLFCGMQVFPDQVLKRTPTSDFLGKFQKILFRPSRESRCWYWIKVVPLPVFSSEFCEIFRTSFYRTFVSEQLLQN